MTNTKNYTEKQLKQFTEKGIFIALSSKPYEENLCFYKLKNLEKIHPKNSHRSFYVAEFESCDDCGNSLSSSSLKFEIYTNYKFRFFPGFPEPLSILDVLDTVSYINGEDNQYASFSLKATGMNGSKGLEKWVEEFFTNNAKLQQNYPADFSILPKQK